MKSLGFQCLPISDIEYDARDISERQKTQRVAELAASRKRLAINPITIAADVDRATLVAGRDRLAADLLNGAHVLWCHVVDDVTELELLEIEVEENVRRRDIDRDQQLARLVTLTEQAAKDLPCKPNGNAPQKGRPVTAKGEARRKVAEVAKVSVEAVRAAQNRAAAKDEPEPAEREPAINLFGLPFGGAVAAVEAVARAHQGHVDEVANALTQALTWLTKAKAAVDVAAEYQPGYPRWSEDAADIDRLREEVKKRASRVRARRPAALCPFGKSGCGVDCNACRGIRYATVEQVAKDAPIPPELLRTGAEAMVSDGRGGFVSAMVEVHEKWGPNGQHSVEVIGDVKPPKAFPKPSKRMTVALPDGRVVDPNEPPPDIAEEAPEDEELF